MLTRGKNQPEQGSSHGSLFPEHSLVMLFAQIPIFNSLSIKYFLATDHRRVEGWSVSSTGINSRHVIIFPQDVHLSPRKR